MDEEILRQNILCKNLSYTKYGNSVYNNLFYIDNKNKVCITFTPRGGCSISFSQYLDLVGLLEDGINYNSFIHNYRCSVFDKCITYKEVGKLIEEKYTFIKFIMNPYIRAVSVYRAQTHNLTFREYLKKLISNDIDDILDFNDKYHYHPQYIEDEEKFITKYIKINENEKYNIKLHDDTIYTLDANNYTSNHHGIKTENTDFCGDIPKNKVNGKLPKSYKYFYDDEIKSLVDIFYKNDIEKYNFSFDNF
jgi:hypothetical protein